MTNAMIILQESVKLMEQGIIKGSGEIVTVEVNGETKQLEMPEPIHTFNGWKERGFKVKKGEHSTIKFPIWKYTVKKVEVDGEEEEQDKMLMRVASFFTADQVEAIAQ